MFQVNATTQTEEQIKSEQGPQTTGAQVLKEDGSVPKQLDSKNKCTASPDFLKGTKAVWKSYARTAKSCNK